MQRIFGQPGRWLETVKVVAVFLGTETSESNYLWRRLQVSEQQAQRQKKNCLQKALTFAKRAKDFQGRDPSSKDQLLAWQKAVDEYNRYGAAASNALLRISEEHSEQLFGFSVSWLISESFSHFVPFFLILVPSYLCSNCFLILLDFVSAMDLMKYACPIEVIALLCAPTKTACLHFLAMVAF